MPENDVETLTPENLNETHHTKLGPILGVLILILVLILAGLFLWGRTMNEPVTPVETPIVNNEPETTRAVADQQIFETLSPSDELDAIDADISATNLDSLDTELGTIDVELDAALQ